MKKSIKKKPFILKIITLVCLSLLGNFLTGCSNNQNKSLETNISSQNNLLHQNTPHEDNQKDSSELKTEEITVDKKKFMVIKIDPKIYHLEIFENNPSSNQKDIFTIHKEQQSLLSFNGQFFTEKFKPTGLLISNKKTLNKFSKAKLMDGIFTVDEKGKAKIYSNNEFQKLAPVEQKNIDFALQNGPLLIKNGKTQIKTDSKKNASRTTLGIDKDGSIILIILRQSIFESENILSLYDFTKFLEEKTELKKFNIVDLVNLDGGPSTGLAIGKNYYPELGKVQNIVLTKKRDLQ